MAIDETKQNERREEEGNKKSFLQFYSERKKIVNVLPLIKIYI